jgi:hypothetical protein
MSWWRLSMRRLWRLLKAAALGLVAKHALSLAGGALILPDVLDVLSAPVFC